jgi:phosphoglycerol transferase MdoB-like AlkP superfamily enzyme
MATATTTVRGVVPGTKLRAGSLIMAIAGAGFIGYAIIFFVRNFGSFLELGIGRGEVNVDKAQIKEFSPSLYDYISHLHIAISGFIAATGLAVIALAWFGVRRGQVWAWVTAVAVPVLALAVALPAHYPTHLDTFGHLGLIYAATLIFVVGAVVAFVGLREQQSV